MGFSSIKPSILGYPHLWNPHILPVPFEGSSNQTKRGGRVSKHFHPINGIPIEDIIQSVFVADLAIAPVVATPKLMVRHLKFAVQDANHTTWWWTWPFLDPIWNTHLSKSEGGFAFDLHSLLGHRPLPQSKPKALHKVRGAHRRCHVQKVELFGDNFATWRVVHRLKRYQVDIYIYTYIYVDISIDYDIDLC